MKPIAINAQQLAAALPEVQPGLQKYSAIQVLVKADTTGFTDPLLRRSYNGFYRVRRGQTWQSVYFDLMHQTQKHGHGFSHVLTALHGATGRYEASFASKLLATLDTSQPVIDSVVLKNLDCKLPAATSPHRVRDVVALHSDLRQNVKSFLGTPDGRVLVAQFNASYPSNAISEEKMVDLVLWQMR
ncbi:hypothetical protein GR140_30570 (plasmid) [Pseudomonas putida]|uniref:hypothetical protein n=1 Tax=Pseudomonas putida TaxID=303 RepID=UPI001BAFB13C|nr:hypothetical protein [Pseudomonas putida]QUG93113.1 hypothetical protein GR140_30570 [Pseudomonas putida]